MSSWTSAANASGIVAVAASAGAVLSVIPVIVRQKFSSRSRRAVSEIRRLQRRIRDQEAELVRLQEEKEAPGPGLAASAVEQPEVEALAAPKRRAVVRVTGLSHEKPGARADVDIPLDEPTAGAHIELQLSFVLENDSGTGKISLARRLLRMESRERVLRVTARSSEEEADIAAAQTQESPSDN